MHGLESPERSGRWSDTYRGVLPATGSWPVEQHVAAERGAGKGGFHEGGPILRWARNAAQGVLGGDPQAHGPAGLPAAPLARDALLRSLWAQGLRAVPRVQG